MKQLSDATLMVLIVLLSIFAPLSTDMFLPALDEMVVYFDTTEQMMSMALYMFMLFLAISVLFLGPVSDKYGRRNVLVVTMLLYTVSSIACSIVPNVESLIIARILQAIGGGGAMVTSVALIRDCFDGAVRSRILSVVAVIGVIGPVASPILGQAIIWMSGWQATFWAPAVVSLICMLIAMKLPQDIPAKRYDGSIMGAVGSLIPIVRNRDFTIFTVMMTMITFCILAYISVSEYIYKDKGFGVGDLYSFYLAAAMILGVVIMMLIMRCRSRIGNKGMLKVFFVMSVISLLILSFLGAQHQLLFFIGVVPLIAVSSMVRSFGFDVLLSQDVGNSGAISSILNFFTFLFATLGMVVVVNLPFGNYVHSVAFCVLIYFVIYVVCWAWIRFKATSIKGLY